MKKQLIFTMILIMIAAFGFSQTFEKQGAGVTIIVHGWNPDGDQPTWMSSMADAIIARSGGDGQMASITVTGSAGNLTATCTDWDFSMATATSGQIVVLLNWTAVANHLTTFVTAQEVAAAVAPKIYQSQNGQFALSEFPIHLIGHSRGGGMVYEIARLLGLQGIDIDHLTSLDPHPLTEADPQPLMGTHTIDTPVALYENVLFADNYYQNIEFPTGQYVTGAYNRLWESIPGGYHNETGYTYNILGTNYNFSDHLNIILAYHGTVDLATPATNGEATMTQSERDAWFNSYEAQGEIEGFYYSFDVAGDRKSTDTPVAGGDQIIDGLHDNALLGGNGARQAQDWTNADWPNILTCDVLKNSAVLPAGTQSFTLEDQIFIKNNYRSYTNSCVITGYVDIDRNPYNDNNVTLIDIEGQSATSSSIAQSSMMWSITGLEAGTKYYLCTKIDDGTHTRFIYSPHELIITQVATPPAVGDGSETNPYEIETLENLYWISQNPAWWNAYYIQTSDIDASSTTTWTSAEGDGFPPIGTETDPFCGTYNGNNHIISNLYINKDADYIGLFGYLGTSSDHASLKNIILENVNISCTSGAAWYAAGALAGYFEYGTIDSCYSSGTINADEGAGGLIGSNNAVVTNSSSSCNVTGTESVGGFMGEHAFSQILNCSASGNVEGTSYVGGFSGYFLGCEIYNCFAKGDVSGNEFVGGFASEMRYSTYNTVISNCYSWGNVRRLSGSTSDYIGGFVAHCDDNGQNPTTVEYSYSTGSVTYEDATNPTDKGFIGMETGSNTYTANFFDYTTSSQTSGLGATPKLTNAMQTMSTFTNAAWDFMGETTNGTDDDWGINSTDNNAYPFLKWQGYKLVPEITEWPVATDMECGLTLADVVLTGGNADASGNFVFRNADIIPPYGTNDFEIIFAPDDFESYDSISNTISVTVIDTENPIPDISTLDDINAECEVTTLTAPTATDNCAGTITGTHDATLPITTQGTTTVTWTYADGNGNSITQTQDVVIEDVTNPVPDVATLFDVTAECEVTTLTDPTATDNCAGAITGTHNATLPITAQGTTTVTWTYDDGNGNIITQTQNVLVNDVTNPTITCLNNQTINLTQGQTNYTVQGTEFDPTSTDDNCDLVSVENDFNNTATLADAQIPPGTTTIVWTVTDNAGNSDYCQFHVVVNEFVGIDNLSISSISIYPNPTNGIVYISSYIDKEVFKNVEITDIHGKTISYFQINKSANIQIDISNKPDGIYFLKIHTNDRFFYSKIIKQ